MPVVSVVGTSGVGKSYLVKQLASLNSAPAFFEGEEGVFPDWVLESVATGVEPIRRWRWFMQRYRISLERAMTISSQGLLCFVDGAILSAQAIKQYEPAELHDELQSLIEACSHCVSDVTILLTASEEYLMRAIAQRGRDAEQHAVVVDRALAIQRAFIALAASDARVLVLDRTGLDFSVHTDLVGVHARVLDALG